MPRVRPNTWDSKILSDVYINNEYGLPNDLRGSVILDIGAHIGAFGLACQKRHARKIVCYEPDPENVELLVHNLDEDIESRTEIHINQAAVTATDRNDLGIRRLSNHDFDRGRNTGHVDVFGAPDGTEGIAFDKVVASIDEPIDLLKIDCEGAEWEIFEVGDFSRIRSIAAELHALPEDAAHPALDKYRGKSLTDLAQAVVTRLRSFGFEVSVLYTGPELANLKATKTASVEVGDIKRPPRVLFVGDAGITTGYARVSEQICRRLVQYGWDVRVLGIGYNGDPHNLPYKVYPAVDPNTGGARNGATRIKSIVQRIKPDIAIIQDDSWNVGILIDQMAMTNTIIPTVGYIAIDSENVRVDVAMQLRNLRHAICHTNYGVKQLELAGYSGAVSVAGHGVDTSLYVPLSKQESREGISDERRNIRDAFIWGAVAVNQPRKRLDLTMAYWAAWWKAAGKPDNAYLYLHTNSDGVYDTKQLSQYLGIKGRVLETEGGLTLRDEQMPTLYNAFDVMLSTAEGESWGMCQHEGLACGIPQIAVRCGGMPEWAGDAIHWVEPSQYKFTDNRTNTKRWTASEQDFVAAMDLLYRDAAYRSELSKRGIEHAAKFKWDDVARHFDKVLKQVLSVQRIATKAANDALSEF